MVKVYRNNNEKEDFSIEFLDGCYGVYAMKKHLLVGNKDGCISFIPFSKIEEKQYSMEMHSKIV
jgi:hypothetical protein